MNDLANPARDSRVPFSHATSRLVIGSLDDTKLTISAQYNPGEIQVTQAGGWVDHKKTQGGADALHVEYSCGQPRLMQVELLFDGRETDGVAGGVGAASTTTVRQAIATLQKMISVRDVRRNFEDARPHFCVVSWGAEGVPSMSCVIDSLATKYQVLSPTGKVLRASCTVALKEARRVDLDRRAPHNRKADAYDRSVTAGSRLP